jgi:hypothetical protein
MVVLPEVAHLDSQPEQQALREKARRCPWSDLRLQVLWVVANSKKPWEPRSLAPSMQQSRATRR